jgi:nitroreductase
VEAGTAVIEALLTRRSSKPALLTEPGPSREQLRTILTAAARVPDHRKLVPWRFIVFEGEARARFGDMLASAVESVEAEPVSDFRRQTERERLMRAPVVVAVIGSPKSDGRTPEREQTLSTGAACQNLCLAANALGFGTSWLTEWYSYNADVDAALGLSADEYVAGFIYIGTASEAQPDRDRPDLDEIVVAWGG